jgi:uncharacterized protein (TIGR02147 family)
VETPPGRLSHHVVEFHRTMMTLAADSLDRVPRDEREIASLTLCLSPEQFLQLKDELSLFRSRLLQRYQTAADSDRVVQLNFQLFPVSQVGEK